MRLHDFERLLKAHGVTVTPGGRHFHARKEGVPVYPIAAHDAGKTELPNLVLRKVCKHFGIDPKKLPI